MEGEVMEAYHCSHPGERNVMVAIDEGEYSHYALVWTLDNLRESVQKTTVLIFMAHPPANRNITFAAGLANARVYCPVSSNPDFVKSVEENQNKLTAAYLEKAKEICASRGVKAETIADVGDPKEAICEAVLKYNVGLLIMGERGLGKIKRAILGSVSSYCLQYAKCPVLVVKKQQ
ncbi:hypothetical protein MLD38_007522 [Melastoma candidum]|uniref:Uncharacterized protein n=1 Tax=Melastoma candidum TaxID=119954 RepID=A0ACB9RSM6_9MYRT|nr:hypothetical protein MLD38_007522 [Melastoma candidum]